jgi:CDP-diacylglycerol--serine O-phosphatidyltransferase
MAERRLRKKPARVASTRSPFRRSLSILPSLFTIGNIFCGYYSVMATIKGNYDNAAIAIGLGAVLDTLDGRIARLTKTTSDFGVQLDSLADFFTFGVAPAVLAFNWGLSSIAGNVSRHVIQLGWMSTLAFTISSAMRLARFNIQSARPPETTSQRYFVVLPTPARAGLTSEDAPGVAAAPAGLDEESPPRRTGPGLGADAHPAQWVAPAFDVGPGAAPGVRAAPCELDAGAATGGSTCPTGELPPRAP